MVQLPSAPSDSGNSRSTSAGALLRDLQHHAGLAGHGVGGGIDLADLVQPPQRDDHLAIVRGLAADQAGIAALRHQRDLVLAGELADRGHFRRRARPQHQRRAAVKQVALLGDVGRDIGGIGHRIFVADDGAKFCDQLGREAAELLEPWTIFIVVFSFIPARSFSSDRCAAQPVVDGFAQPLVRNRHHRDGARALAVERAKMAEQIGGGLVEIAALRQIHHRGGGVNSRNCSEAERQQRLAGLERCRH